jgi:DNA-binding IclR family transcriptional regulator
MAGNSSHPGRGVISKAFSLLEAFRPANRELSLNQLARRTDLPISTVYRTANELVECGGLERVDGGGYRVGLRLWEIGSLSDRATSMLTVVVPFMQDLYEVTHETVQLAILDGRDALFIEKLYGTRSAMVRSTRGGRLPLHCTGVGKVLLAHAPPELAEQLLENGLQRFTRYTLTTPQELTRALDEVRRTGLAFQREEMDLGLVSVAAPIMDADNTVVASLSVVVRSSRIQLRQLAPAVQTAAASASREMREHSVRGANADGMLRMLRAGQPQSGDGRLPAGPQPHPGTAGARPASSSRDGRRAAAGDTG